MKNKKYGINSITDAFLALNDILDEEIKVNNLKEKSKLKEAASVDLNNIDQVEKAQEFRKADEKSEDNELEVIDVDADSLNELKDSGSYIGKILLQCNSCKATKFVDVDKLKQNENDPELYNTEDECPHCHNTGTGYALIGQVGKKTEEPTLDNTTNNGEEAMFDNTNDVEPQAEETPTEETSNEEDTEENNGETSYDETNASDDTDELNLPELGDEFDVDDVMEDDTEEKSDDEDKKKVKKESLNESNDDPDEEDDDEYEDDNEADYAEDDIHLATSDYAAGQWYEGLDEKLDMATFEGSIANLIDTFTIEDNPVNIKLLNKNGSELGMYGSDDLPFNVKSQMMDTFNTDDNYLEVNVTENGNGTTVNDLFNYYRPDEDNQTTFVVTNVDTDEEEDFEDLTEFLEKYGDYYIDGALGLRTLNIYIADGDLETEVEPLDDEEIKELGKENAEKEEAEVTEESLIEEIIKSYPGLKLNRINNALSEEYFIADSIRLNEDIDLVYKNFVKPTNNEKLIEHFKSYTGYEDEVDKFLKEHNISKDQYNKIINEDLFHPDRSQEVKDILAKYNANQRHTRDNVDELIRCIKEIKKKFGTTIPIYLAWTTRKLSYATALRILDGWYLREAHLAYSDKRNGILLDYQDEDLMCGLEKDKDKNTITEDYNIDDYLEDLAEDSFKENKYIDNYDDFKEICREEGFTDISQADFWLYKKLCKKCKKAKVNEEAELITLFVYDKDDKELTRIGSDAKEALDYLKKNKNASYITYTTNSNGSERDYAFKNTDGTIKIHTYINSKDEYDYVDKLNGNVEGVNEKLLTSVKTRAELGETINKLVEAKEKYRIAKSLTEGYRYDIFVNEDCELTEGFDDKLVRKVLAEAKDEYNRYKDETDEPMEYFIGQSADAFGVPFDKWYIFLPDHISEEDEEFKAFKRGYEDNGGKVNEGLFDSDEVDVLDDGDAEAVDTELVDQTPTTNVEEPVETTDIVPDDMRPEDIEVVEKIDRIATDIIGAIQEAYGVDVSDKKNLIVADIIQDLQLIGGEKAVEDLENTPINELTKQMYQEFNGFYDAMDEMISFFTGERITTSQADRLAQAIKSLDSKTFSTDVIYQQIDSPRFLQAAESGAIPYIDPTLLQAPTDESLRTFDEDYNTEDRLAELKKIKKERKLTDDEAEELAYCENEVDSRHAEQNYLNGIKEEIELNDDNTSDEDCERRLSELLYLQDQRELTDEEQEELWYCENRVSEKMAEDETKNESNEINLEDFDNCINEYLEDNEDDLLAYKSSKIEKIDEQLIINGLLESNNGNKEIQFTLTKVLNEDNNKTNKYIVKNNLNDSEFNLEM